MERRETAYYDILGTELSDEALLFESENESDGEYSSIVGDMSNDEYDDEEVEEETEEEGEDDEEEDDEEGGDEEGGDEEEDDEEEKDEDEVDEEDNDDGDDLYENLEDYESYGEICCNNCEGCRECQSHDECQRFDTNDAGEDSEGYVDDGDD